MTSEKISIHEAQEWIENLSYEKLRSWLQCCLEAQDSSPLDFDFSSNFFEDEIVAIYNLSSNTAFKQRFESALEELISEWSSASNRLAYFESMVIIAGYLKLSRVWSVLLRHVNTGEFKGQMVRSIDLHHSILMTFLSLDPGTVGLRRVLSFCEREIMKEAVYAPVCFRFISEHNPEEGFRHLPALLSHLESDNQAFHFDLIVSDLLSTHGWKFFCSRLIPVYIGESDAHRKSIRTALLEIGITLTVYKSSFSMYDIFSSDREQYIYRIGFGPKLNSFIDEFKLRTKRIITFVSSFRNSRKREAVELLSSQKLSPKQICVELDLRMATIHIEEELFKSECQEIENARL